MPEPDWKIDWNPFSSQKDIYLKIFTRKTFAWVKTIKTFINLQNTIKSFTFLKPDISQLDIPIRRNPNRLHANYNFFCTLIISPTLPVLAFIIFILLFLFYNTMNQIIKKWKNEFSFVDYYNDHKKFMIFHSTRFIYLY